MILQAIIVLLGVFAVAAVCSVLIGAFRELQPPPQPSLPDCVRAIEKARDARNQEALRRWLRVSDELHERLARSPVDAETKQTVQRCLMAGAGSRARCGAAGAVFGGFPEEPGLWLLNIREEQLKAEVDRQGTEQRATAAGRME